MTSALRRFSVWLATQGEPLAGPDAITRALRASYVAAWLEAIHADKKLVVVAGARAQRAADCILGCAWEGDGGQGDAGVVASVRPDALARAA